MPLAFSTIPIFSAFNHTLGGCQGASPEGARRRRATLDNLTDPNTPLQGEQLKSCFPLPNGECPRSGNGSRDWSLVGVKGQTAPALGERRNCDYLDFDIKKRASLKEKFKKPSKIKAFGFFCHFTLVHHLLYKCLVFAFLKVKC